MNGGSINHGGLERLCVATGRRWKPLDIALNESSQLRVSLAERFEKLIPADASFVTYGSVARGEYTVGSDIDWTLLVDGQADPGHFNAAQAIRAELDAMKLEGPGPTATFGSVTFSHELVHHIGGASDSNRNTTQRILLLLESAPIGSPDAHERVIRAILARYLDNDISFLTKSRSGRQYKVPRFLLNDIVRYWRTMCVDYATKFRERQGAEWALRNAKLRMSRKLIFAAGLMMCFSCYLTPPQKFQGLFDVTDELGPIIVHLRSFVARTPMDILVDAFCEYTDESTAVSFVDAYAGFLAVVADGGKRKILKALPAERANSDELFETIREMSDNFQKALTKLFFGSREGKLTELTHKYGLF